MTPTWLGDLEQGTAPPWPLLSTNRPLSLSFPISKNHGSWSESWMITEGPSQGPMSHGLHLSLPLPPRRSVSFETTLVPLPAHLEPHLSPKGKAMLKISETISRQLGGGGVTPKVKRRVRTGDRCWFLWTQKCSSFTLPSVPAWKKAAGRLCFPDLPF